MLFDGIKPPDWKTIPLMAATAAVFAPSSILLRLLDLSPGYKGQISYAMPWQQPTENAWYCSLAGRMIKISNTKSQGYVRGCQTFIFCYILKVSLLLSTTSYCAARRRNNVDAPVRLPHSLFPVSALCGALERCVKVVLKKQLNWIKR